MAVVVVAVALAPADAAQAPCLHAAHRPWHMARKQSLEVCPRDGGAICRISCHAALIRVCQVDM